MNHTVVFTFAVTLGLMIPVPAGAEPVPACPDDDPVEFVTCTLLGLNPEDYLCIGIFPLRPSGLNMAQFTGIAPYATTDIEASYAGVLVASGGSGPLSFDHDSFIFVGGTTNAADCDRAFAKVRPGSAGQYWTLGTLYAVVEAIENVLP